MISSLGKKLQLLKQDIFLLYKWQICSTLVPLLDHSDETFKRRDQPIPGGDSPKIKQRWRLPGNQDKAGIAQWCVWRKWQERGFCMEKIISSASRSLSECTNQGDATLRCQGMGAPVPFSDDTILLISMAEKKYRQLKNGCMLSHKTRPLILWQVSC